MDVSTVGPWAVRMLLLALGGWLTRTYSVGDATLWGNLADTLAGPIVVAGTAVWSWRATKAQKAELPANVVGVTADLVSGPAVATAQHVEAVAQSTAAVVDGVAELRQQVTDLRAQLAGALTRPVA